MAEPTVAVRVRDKLPADLRPGQSGEVLPHRLEGEFPVLVRFRRDGAVKNYRDEEVEVSRED